MLRKIHEICFPEDDYYGTCDAEWWVGFHNHNPVCFAGIDIDSKHAEGFLCRAGVIPEYQGMGLQKRLIRTREKYARSIGITGIWTYVHPTSPASLNSLYSQGFKAYLPYHEDIREEGFVHMMKEL